MKNKMPPTLPKTIINLLSRNKRKGKNSMSKSIKLKAAPSGIKVMVPLRNSTLSNLLS